MTERLHLQETDSRPGPTLFVGACQNCGQLRGADGDCPGDKTGIHIYMSAVEVVPRSEAEALAEALERLASSGARFNPALVGYRSRHPKETP
jgi:hypothetical protein